MQRTWRSHHLQTAADAAGMLLSHGRHAGKSLGDLVKIDERYVRWLANASRTPELRRAAQQVIRDSQPSRYPPSATDRKEPAA